jgi:hypothetical protein
MTDASPAHRPVLFARTAEGWRLPIIDLTHPAFAGALTPAELPARVAAFVAEQERQRAPRWLMRLFLKLAARQSYLIRAMGSAKAGYLPAMTTYLLKLGGANLVPPADTPIDRKIVESLAGQSLLLRLGQVAELLATGLMPRLAAAPGRPLDFLNIAGGPAIDSLNALILLRRDAPALLAGRQIRINVLDIDAAGPAFGRSALTALTGATGPLAGLAVIFEPIAWDWRDLNGLTAFLAALPASGSIIAASSEGGLFEYGSDAEITGVLSSLRQASEDAIFAGSVTRNDRATQLLASRSSFRIRTRGLDLFTPLAEGAGWRVDETRQAAFSDQVLLRPVA